MSIYKQAIVTAAVLSFLLPADAAECAPDLDEVNCADQVKVTLNSMRILVATSHIDDQGSPLSPSPTRSNKVLLENGRFSEEGSAMRWLYSTVTEKRFLAMYTGAQRGRPAELRIRVRLSLL